LELAFVKRLAKNEIGSPTALSRHGIHVPKRCESFFPALADEPNASREISVQFYSPEEPSSPSAVRLVRYNQASKQNKRECRLTQLPANYFSGAAQGDFVVVRHRPDQSWSATLIPQQSNAGQSLLAIAGSRGGKLLPVDQLPEISWMVATAPVLMSHPLARGRAPTWATGWGEDADFGPFLDFTVKDVTQRLRWIPPGRFRMGSPDDEPGREEIEGPQHEVTISEGFWLFDTPCTQALYAAVTGDNPSRFKTQQRPVENVSWQDSQQFIEKLHSLVPGLQASLPSEAEWEYACRAGTGDATYAGPIEIISQDNAPVLHDIAWYGGNCGVDFDLADGESTDWKDKQFEFSHGGTRNVAQKQANPWGLYDMLGNVLEWCRDCNRAYEAEGVVDPEGTGEASADRVVRGGSWFHYARDVRAACRRSYSPGARSFNPQYYPQVVS